MQFILAYMIFNILLF